MRDQIEAFRRHLETLRSPRTAKTYAAVLSSFVSFVEVPSRGGTPSRSDAEAFLARPRQDGRRRSVAARNQDLAALRAFAKYALRDLGWSENPTDGIPFLREPPRDPAVLGVGEVRRLFNSAGEVLRGHERSGALAILALLSQSGLRVHELVALDVDQMDLASLTLVDVSGKGGSIHDLPLNAPTIALLVAWIADRIRIAKPEEQALFVSSRGTRVSVRTVERLMARLRTATGSAKHITPHTLRHSCATLALTSGSDLSTVADLLRHADVNTTRRYLHLVDERRREAVRRLGSTIPESVLPQPSEMPAVSAGSLVAPNALDAQYDLDAINEAA